jgi:hypothetical protein
LFFLAALYQASRRSNIAYFRKTSEGVCSLFVMKPVESGGDDSGGSDDNSGGNGGCSVRVWFSRNVVAASLDEVCRSAVDLQVINYDAYYAFVDGPRYPRGGECTADVLGKGYDYLCTSGGMPDCKNDEYHKRLWILDGWSRKESVDYLMQYLHGNRLPGDRGGESELELKAEEAYDVCGGCIRSMLAAVSSTGGLEREKDSLRSMVDRLDFFKARLLLKHPDRGLDGTDRLWTMFAQNDSKYRMGACQIPDSAYVLGLVRGKVGLDAALEARGGANLIFGADPPAAEGRYFELAFHAAARWDQGRPQAERAMHVVHGLATGKGPTWEVNLDALALPNRYWTPTLLNFPLIDSALVHNNTLYAFQRTIQRDHSFNEDRFVRIFNRVKSKVFQSLKSTAVVYFVHPHSVDFKGRVGEASVPLRPRREADRSEGGALTIRLRARPVDVTFQDAFKRSVVSLFQQVHDDAVPEARG